MSWGEWLSESYADWKACVGAFAWRARVRAWHFVAAAVAAACIALVANNAWQDGGDAQDASAGGQPLQPALPKAPQPPAPTTVSKIKEVRDDDVADLNDRVTQLERKLARGTLEMDRDWHKSIAELQAALAELERESRDKSR
jgi:hypothetical protein